VHPEAIDSISPLAADLRAHDPDRYTASLFAPPFSRDALIALYAFDHELARLPKIVREPMAGLIRLQWWQDIIDRIDDNQTTHHPVVQGLHRALTKGGLDAVHLKRAIDGRRRPFEDERPSDLQTFERYLLDIGGSITSAAAALLGAEDGETMAVANRVGLVRAAFEQLITLERPVSDLGPWLPSEWLESPDHPNGRASTAGANTCLATWALGELAEARRQQGSIVRSLLAAFFPGTLAGIRLRGSIGRSHQTRLPTAVPKLIWCWIRGRF